MNPGATFVGLRAFRVTEPHVEYYHVDKRHAGKAVRNKSLAFWISTIKVTNSCHSPIAGLAG